MKWRSVIDRIRGVVSVSGEAEGPESTPLTSSVPEDVPSPVVANKQIEFSPMPSSASVKFVPPTPLPMNPPPPRRVTTGPATVTLGIKEQTEWALAQISECAKAFVAHAEKNGLSVARPLREVGVLERHDVTALMLGYKIVRTTVHCRFKEPSREVAHQVRAAMVGLLLQAARDHAHQLNREKISEEERPRPLPIEAAEAHLRAADAQILVATAEIQQNGESAAAWTGFYADLSPAFGTASGVDPAHQKYSEPIRKSFLNARESLLKKAGPALD